MNPDSGVLGCAKIRFRLVLACGLKIFVKQICLGLFAQTVSSVIF
jgi:hypothetical protein